MQTLRVLIADDEPIIRLDLKQMLADMGHLVVGEAADGATALHLARQVRPDLAILDVKMPVMDGIDAAAAIASERICPVLILTAYGQTELVERARDAGVFGYLMKPFTENDLYPSIEITISRFRELQQLEEQVGSLQDALETRKVVERAKAVLMEKYGLKEPEAFRRIQQQSMRTRKPMKEIAEAILLASDL
ncbi:MAG: ANTAR domain-containing response regulator [Armatimonadota bacterium]